MGYFTGIPIEDSETVVIVPTDDALSVRVERQLMPGAKLVYGFIVPDTKTQLVRQAYMRVKLRSALHKVRNRA